MSYCPNCGHEITAGARFCEYCGTQLAAAATVVTPVIATASSAADYTVLLTSLNTCSADTAASLIADACGYSDTDALQLVSALPCPVAQNLTRDQAAYLAQALTEYGMDISVYDGVNYQDVDTGLDTVYTKAGGFLAKAAAVLGLIGAGNRLTRSMMRRYDYPYRYATPRPPMYRRRVGAPVPPPRRAPRRTPEPRPMMEPRPAAHAPRPAAAQPSRSPMGGTRGGQGAPQGGNRGGQSGPQGGRGGQGGPQGGRGGQGGPGGRGGMGGPGGRR